MRYELTLFIPNLSSQYWLDPKNSEKFEQYSSDAERSIDINTALSTLSYDFAEFKKNIMQNIIMLRRPGHYSEYGSICDNAIQYGVTNIYVRDVYQNAIPKAITLVFNTVEEAKILISEYGISENEYTLEELSRLDSCDRKTLKSDRNEIEIHISTNFPIKAENINDDLIIIKDKENLIYPNFLYSIFKNNLDELNSAQTSFVRKKFYKKSKSTTYTVESIFIFENDIAEFVRMLTLREKEIDSLAEIGFIVSINDTMAI